MSHLYADLLKAMSEGKVVEYKCKGTSNPWAPITYSTHACTSLIQGSERGYQFRVQTEKMSAGQLVFKKMYPNYSFAQLNSESIIFYEDLAKSLIEAHTKGELK